MFHIGRKALGCAAVILSSVFIPVHADDGSWAVDTGGLWSDSANWLDGVIPSGGMASFSNHPMGKVGSMITLDNNTTITGILLRAESNFLLYFDSVAPSNSTVPYRVDYGTNSFLFNGNRAMEWGIPAAGSGAFTRYGSALFSFCFPQEFTGELNLEKNSNTSIDYRFGATRGGESDTGLLQTKNLYMNGGNLRIYGRYPRHATQLLCVLTPGSADIEMVDANQTTRSVRSAGQWISSPYFSNGTYVARIKSSDSRIITLSSVPLETLTVPVTQVVDFAESPAWHVRQSFSTITMNGESTIDFRAGKTTDFADGTNTVTLEVGTLTGKGKLNIGLDTEIGGRNGTFLVHDATSFRYPVNLQDQAAFVFGTPPVTPEQPTEEETALADPALWMDASVTESLTINDKGEVTAWADVRGDGHVTANSWLEKPTLLENALNGLAVVDFGTLGSRKALAWDREIKNIRAVFLVLGSQETGGTLLGAKPGCTTSYRRGFDPINAIPNTSPEYRILRHNGLIGYNTATNDYVAVNGQEIILSGAGTSLGYDVYTFSLPNKEWKASAFAFDPEYSDSSRFSGGQRLAEVLVYTNSLTVTQCKRVEAYLQKKWFARDTDGYGSPRIRNVLLADEANARFAQEGTVPVRVERLSGNGAFTLEEGTDLTVDIPENGLSGTLRNGSTLRINARKIPSLPKTDGAILWLDASRADSLSVTGENRVTAWNNLVSGSITDVTPGTVQPSRVQDAEGRWLVDLGNIGEGCVLRCLTNLMARTVFFVWFPRSNGTQPLGSLKKSYLDNETYRNTGDFYRNGWGSIVPSSASVTARNGRWFTDGEELAFPYMVSYPTNRLLLTSGVMQGWGGRVSAIGGWGFNDTDSSWSFSGGFQLGEMLIYQTTLSDTERRDVEAYLSKKWLGRTLDGYGDGAFRLGTLTIDGTASLENTGDLPVILDKLTGTGTLSLTEGNRLLVKKHDPTVEILNNVNAGVDAFRADVTENVPANDPILWLDADRKSSISFMSGIYAQYWTDRAQGIRLESAAGEKAWVPKYTNACNGKAVIDFDAHAEWNTSRNDYSPYRAYKWSPRLTTIRTVFWMFRDNPTIGGGFLLGDSTKWSDFLRGDFGNQRGESAIFDASRASANVLNGEIYSNGSMVSPSMIPGTDWQVLSVVTTGNTAADMIAGDRNLDTKKNWGGLQLGEMIIYDRPLNSKEQAQTEDYLMSKWLNQRSPRRIINDTMGIVTGGMTVTNRADTEEGFLSGLQGNGVVTFESANVTVCADPENFSGTARLKGNSTVTLDALTYSASTWIIEEGSVLDLGGKTVFLNAVGGGGTVSNGTLSVNRLILGSSGVAETLTIDGNLILAENAAIDIYHPARFACSACVTGKWSLQGNGTITVIAEESANFHSKILTYATAQGTDRLTEWSCEKVPSSGRFKTTMSHDADNRILVVYGTASGTFILIR